MGILERLFGRKKTRKFEGVEPIEWQGPDIVVPLRDRPAHPREREWLADRRRRSVWARVDVVPNRQGRPKLVLQRGGYSMGEIPAATIRGRPELQQVLAAGVTVAVVSISIDGDDEIVFGRHWKYRPRPPWV